MRELNISQPLPQRRLFTTPPRRYDATRESIQIGAEHALNEINEMVERKAQQEEKDARLARRANSHSDMENADLVPEQDSTTLDPSEASELVAHIPWYLQQSSEVTSTESPMANRQRLPDLPDHPPPLLQPLLNHVSVELGMDDLSLLDLRQLDPPPALGANLIMIVGTARSEKHLHVSADRLCRWLRTEYKMTPFADGLLGRNELKLKMKRKAKRARLMSAVGAKSTGEGEADDGIRTGWVCVNLGKVEGGELPDDAGKVQRAEGIIGFGAKSTGTNIVLQLMTEEKRGEVDLEKLWTGIMNRARRDKAKEDIEDATAAVSESTPGTVAEKPVVTDGTNTYYPANHGSDIHGDQQLQA
jgi:hypothetical protein